MTSSGRRPCFVVVEGCARSYTVRSALEAARVVGSSPIAIVTSRRRRRRRWCASLPTRVIPTSHTRCTRVHRHHRRDGGAPSARHVAPHPRGEAHHRECFNASEGRGETGY